MYARVEGTKDERDEKNYVQKKINKNTNYVGKGSL